MNDVFSLDDFTSRLMPLTYFRRNAGEVIARLSKEGVFIITKDGKPVARLSIVAGTRGELTDKEKIKSLKKAVGGFKLGKGMSPSQMNKLLDDRYAEMLPR